MNGPRLDRMPDRILFAHDQAGIRRRYEWIMQRDLRVTADQIAQERARRKLARANKKGSTK